MPRTDRSRVDYMPGAAAAMALELAAEMYPRLRTQEIIDKLVITGLSALRHKLWHPPYLSGRDRDKWALPASLVPVEPP